MPSFPKPKYPWHQWLDGNVHVLKRGVHFECNVHSMRSNAHRTARSRRCEVDTATLLEGEMFVLVAFAHQPPEQSLAIAQHAEAST